MLSHVEDLERRMLMDLAEKGGEVINMLQKNALPAEDCNLVPGEEFVFNAPGAT
jgi:hypothetical protein